MSTHALLSQAANRRQLLWLPKQCATALVRRAVFPALCLVKHFDLPQPLFSKRATRGRIFQKTQFYEQVAKHIFCGFSKTNAKVQRSTMSHILLVLAFAPAAGPRNTQFSGKLLTTPSETSKLTGYFFFDGVPYGNPSKKKSFPYEDQRTDSYLTEKKN